MAFHATRRLSTAAPEAREICNQIRELRLSQRASNPSGMRETSDVFCRSISVLSMRSSFPSDPIKASPCVVGFLDDAVSHVAGFGADDRRTVSLGDARRRNQYLLNQVIAAIFVPDRKQIRPRLSPFAIGRMAHRAGSLLLIQKKALARAGVPLMHHPKRTVSLAEGWVAGTAAATHIPTLKKNTETARSRV